MIYDSPPGEILRSTFQIRPGADPGRIALRYNVPMQMDADVLVFQSDSGKMIASAPVAWQVVNGKLVGMDVAFRRDDSLSTVHFTTGAYDPVAAPGDRSKLDGSVKSPTSALRCV